MISVGDTVKVSNPERYGLKAGARYKVLLIDRIAESCVVLEELRTGKTVWARLADVVDGGAP